MRILVTGGVRSGKSRHAESLLPADRAVTYVAPGPAVEDESDPEWTARIEAHRSRRPASWTTLETHDLPRALAVPAPVIVDCLGTWLTAVLDENALWDSPGSETVSVIGRLLDDVTEALSARDDVVWVTNEVGLGVVPSHRSGRLFRDLLGSVNQQIAAACDEVHLVVAGRVLVL
ncbi:MAG: bifunctional adenosylcobinamide kinase/adenosylcobinamide-phosphate guanylyltransferase [Aeromicrobium sp.]|uniref:bifunctional adenosylcobinamide kinase/adenosylcobinamide-phosphate guanylyltransferase n=1 Tax=Aeromicrobium sp. TaxID=1871063 RepID=UPI0039E4652E